MNIRSNIFKKNKSNSSKKIYYRKVSPTQMVNSTNQTSAVPIKIDNSSVKDSFSRIIESFSNKAKQFYVFSNSILSELNSSLSILGIQALYSKCILQVLDEPSSNKINKISLLFEHIENINEIKGNLDKILSKINENFRLFYDETKATIKKLSYSQVSYIEYDSYKDKKCYDTRYRTYKTLGNSMNFNNNYSCLNSLNNIINNNTSQNLDNVTFLLQEKDKNYYKNNENNLLDSPGNSGVTVSPQIHRVKNKTYNNSVLNNNKNIRSCANFFVPKTLMNDDIICKTQRNENNKQNFNVFSYFFKSKSNEHNIHKTPINKRLINNCN